MRNKKFFASWLTYIVAVIGIFWYGYLSGFIHDSLYLDKSHIGLGILIFYYLLESSIGWRFWKTSQNLDQVDLANQFLKDQNLHEVTIDGESVVLNRDDKAVLKISNTTALGGHIWRLYRRTMLWKGGKPRLNSEILLDSLRFNILSKNSIPTFGMEVLMFSALVGTIYGLILSFMPFIGNTVQLAEIVNMLPQIFASVGAAFYPSLLAAILTLILSFNRWNLNRGSKDLIIGIANFGETHLVPVLEHRDVEE